MSEPAVNPAVRAQCLVALLADGTPINEKDDSVSLLYAIEETMELVELEFSENRLHTIHWYFELQ